MSNPDVAYDEAVIKMMSQVGEKFMFWAKISLQNSSFL